MGKEIKKTIKIRDWKNIGATLLLCMIGISIIFLAIAVNVNNEYTNNHCNIIRDDVFCREKIGLYSIWVSKDYLANDLGVYVFAVSGSGFILFGIFFAYEFVVGKNFKVIKKDKKYVFEEVPNQYEY
jgi:hypothetical protein